MFLGGQALYSELEDLFLRVKDHVLGENDIMFDGMDGYIVDAHVEVCLFQLIFDAGQFEYARLVFLHVLPEFRADRHLLIGRRRPALR